MIVRQNLRFTTIEYLSRNNELALVTFINKIVSYYKSHSLRVDKMFVELEFQFLEEEVVSTIINTIGAHEHVPEVERKIQVIK